MQNDDGREVGGWHFHQREKLKGMTFNIIKYAPIHLFISNMGNKLKYTFH